MSESKGVIIRFVNFYLHCATEWNDAWDSMCNDECPVCGAEIEPYRSTVV